MPQVICNVLRVHVAALGRPVVATLIIAMAIVVNAVGNYILVFGHFGAPAMGLEGSAWATVITAFATLAAYVLVVTIGRRLSPLPACSGAGGSPNGSGCARSCASACRLR